MREIIERYNLDEYFIPTINAFMQSNVEFVANYERLCDARPRNIYKMDVDIKSRYINESIVIYLATSVLVSKGFRLKQIIKEIKELEEFFPWIEDLELCSMNFRQTSFSNIMQDLLESFFKTIEQRTYGEFYSPTTIIAAGLRHIEVSKNKRVIDPSCGCGYFLSVYIDELVSRGELNTQGDLETLQQNLCGYDIFPFGIIVSKMMLGDKCASVFASRDNVFKFNKLQVQNTMKTLTCKKTLFDYEIVDASYDLILGNPPYFRIDPHEANEICTCVSYGHNYIHNLFLHWSIQHIADGGEICLVLPQSILSGLYYKKIRGEMLRKCGVERIIANVEKFFNVQQEIMILILKAQEEVQDYIIEVLNDEGITHNEIQIPLRLVDNTNQLIPTFKDEYELEILNRLAHNPIIERLGELNLSTGNFVWNQNKDSCLSSFQEGAVRVINGPNITEDGFNDHANNTTFPYCIPNNPKYIKTETAILFRRMSPIGNEQRMVAAIINDLNGYVVENHVNMITCEDIELLPQVLEFMTSIEFNVLINSFCQTNQVSTNELKTIFTVLQKLREMV